ncbi:MAG: hypothetical protein ACOYIL_13990, partial [Brevibacillus sp.]
AEQVVKGARLAHPSMRCTLSSASVDECAGLPAWKAWKLLPCGHLLNKRFVCNLSQKNSIVLLAFFFDTGRCLANPPGCPNLPAAGRKKTSLGLFDQKFWQTLQPFAYKFRQ